MTDKIEQLIKTLSEKILNEFGIKIVKFGESTALETQEGTREEHVKKLSGILAVQAALFKHALRLSIALKPENEGIGSINHVRKSAIDIMNKIADEVLESYVDNEITTKRVEVNHD